MAYDPEDPTRFVLAGPPERGHLIANSLPLLVLGTVMLQLYPTAAFRVLPAIYLGPGVAVWLFAREGIHVGASGLVYGLVSYIFVAGLIRRDRRAIAASLLVALASCSAAAQRHHTCMRVHTIP